MAKINKILLASGCSHTAGGGFDVIHLFKKEFPNVDTSKFKIYAQHQFDKSDINFVNSYKSYLWPDILANMIGYKKVFNLAKNGGCIDTALESLYHFIFHWIKDKKNTNELEVFLQIPHYNRIAVFFGEDKNQEVILPLEVEEGHKLTGLFYHYFHDDTLSFFKSIHKLYLFKKFCDGWGIKVYFIPYDGVYKIGSEQENRLKNKLKENININNHEKITKCRTSIDVLNFYDYKDMLSEMDFIYDSEKKSLIENNIFNEKNMKFSTKYPSEKDGHLTKEGHLAFAVLIFSYLKKLKK